MGSQSRRRMIAVAFGPRSMAEALSGLPRIEAEADCVELRLDAFEEPYDLSRLLHARGTLPMVVTLRPVHEGGTSTLPAAERLRVLRQAAELGAEYIDLEWDATSPQAIESLHAAGAQVLVSRHDFSGMPRLAEEWWPELASRGADIVKVVGTAKDVRDCLAVFQTFAGADRPAVAIAMGAPGLITRVLALREETCLLTYAMVDEATSTAPGQLSVRDMREVYRAGRLGPRTRAFGLLGPHIERDRLAEYNAWFETDRFDGIAVPVQVEHSAESAAIVDAFRQLPISGWHIHGAELQAGVGQALDEISATACRQGKVNAIVARADGSLLGEWVESPREQYALWTSSGR